MAKIDSVALRLTAHTRLTRLVGMICYPLVAAGLMSVDAAVAFAMRFVRVDVREL